ncbi:MAG: hypothetical protein K0R65_1588 [Crocinitomicaceae bacterium]|jgi:hypothetical protein|nr:hypothetical protein [Crocinitomicaceae bacterium]
MKAILLYVSFLLISGSYAQMELNKVNVFTLLVDYDNPQFEGGNISYYDCPSCSNDSVPLLIDYQEPGDVGGITFRLEPTGDTLFNGSIIWMGQGQINQPSAFNMESPFIMQDDIIGMPENVSYFDMQGRPISDPQFVNAAENAWYEVNQLEIVKTASENGFKTAMLMYTPAVGVFNPEVAKWVIFFYRNVQLSSLQESVLNPFTVYPNPAKSLINVSAGTAKVSHFEIRNNLGQVIQTGNLDSHTILLTGMADGIYFLDLRDREDLVQRIRFQKF